MEKILKVCLVGNPNTGKSTLFNLLTGLKQKTGNFPGVTVEKKVGYFIHANTKVQILDLPGMYSLSSRSIDERIALQALYGPDTRPDLIVMVADATNLKRNLVLFTQLAELSIPIILVLNMIDLLDAQGKRINVDLLSEHLGVPVLATNARESSCIKRLKQTIISCSLDFAPKGSLALSYVDKAVINKMRTYFPTLTPIQVGNIISAPQNVRRYSDIPPEVYATIDDLLTQAGVKPADLKKLDTLARYKHAETMLKDVYTPIELGCVAPAYRERFDKIFTHKIWGLLTLVLVLFVTFQLIFTVAEYPKAWIEDDLSSFLQNTAQALIPAGIFADFLADGLIPGITTIFAFLPQIVLLFGFINFLEDSGYMARIIFILDRIMRAVGLSGRSVVSLMGGMACAVPAIVASRTVDNRSTRLLTIFVTPLMSCSARLPVYVLLISCAIAPRYLFGFINLQGLVMLGMYFLGFAAAILSAWIFSLFMKKDKSKHFIMELPGFIMPKMSSILYSMYAKSKQFVIQVGSIIIVVSVLLWALSSYGPPSQMQRVEAKYAAMEQLDAHSEPEQLDILCKAELLEHSYAGLMGKFIEPAIKPLGYDWKIGIALVTSLAAREAFVSSMATIYSVDDADTALEPLEAKLQSIDPATGKKYFSFAVAISLMIFYAFAMQCMSTIAVVYRETRSVKWTAMQFLYMTALAYLLSFITYNVLIKF